MKAYRYMRRDEFQYINYLQEGSEDTSKKTKLQMVYYIEDQWEKYKSNINLIFAR